MLENLEHLKQYGMDNFLQNEKIRWTCVLLPEK